MLQSWRKIREIAAGNLYTRGPSRSFWNLTTTHGYVEADLTMKKRALANIQEPDTKIPRYQAPDALLQFLKTL